MCSLGDKKNSSCLFKSAKGWAQDRIKEAKNKERTMEGKEMRKKKKEKKKGRKREKPKRNLT